MKECPACRRCFPDHFNNCPSDGDQLMHSIVGEPMLDGRYQLEQRLGQGGMGVVFKARHLFLKTAHAIKIILPDLVGNDPMLITRFRQEAMAAAAVRHQNIIAVTDFGVARGTMPFLVMEYVQGRSLHDILEKQGRLSGPQALDIMAGIAAGVGAAHRHGIVHRDLKPLNIMLQDGLPTTESIKVLDFGLAKIKSGELLGSFVAAQTTGLMGSPFYMAPEQWSEEEPDLRADIYSLGVILYQMLAGDVPFKGPSIPAIMKKHLMSDPPAFSELGAQVPPTIEAVVRRTLEKEPERRPETVEAFVAELREAIAASHNDALAKTQIFAPDVSPVQTLIESPPQPSQPVLSVPTIETKQKEEEQSAARLQTEGEERERAETEERARAEREAAERQRQEEEQARIAREQEAARLRAEEEARQTAARRQQEEAEIARRRAEEEEAARLHAAEIERQREADEATRREREREIAAANARAAEEQHRREEYERQQRLLDEHRKAEQARAEQFAHQEAEERARREQAAAEQRAREEHERQERERAEIAARMASTSLAQPTQSPPQHAPGTQTGQYGQSQGTLAPHVLNPNTAPTLMPDSFPPPPPTTTQGGQTSFPPNAQQSQANLHASQSAFQGSQPQFQTSQPTFQSSQPQLNPSLHGFPGATAIAPRKSRAPIMIGIVALLALAMIGSVIAYMLIAPGRVEVVDSPRNENGGANTSPTPSASPGGGTTATRADMVAIPGGTFQMGRAGGSQLETPVRPMTVASFHIDRTEVTNAEYAEFVSATDHRLPRNWSGQNPPAGQERWPANNVSFDDAVAFAQWRSTRDNVQYRLPTEAEWEFAARGTDNRLYPWGSAWDETRANLGTGAGRADDFPKPVGSYPTGATSTGVLDMIGNVWEWTSSEAALYPGNPQDLSDVARGRMAVRGGSHQSLHPESIAARGNRPFQATQRAFYPRGTLDDTVGFRLVRVGS